jgi:dipeptidase D
LWTAGQSYPIYLAKIDGGGLANAIPREAKAVVGVAAENVAAFKSYAKEFSAMIHSEYLLAEGADFTFDVTETNAEDKVIDKETACRLISAVYACPNGVQGMSNAVEGLVETSCNLASVKMEEGNKVVVTVHERSSIDSRRDEIADRVKALFTMIGADVHYEDSYVGWAPNPNSNILKVAEQSYKDLFGTAPKVEALHAGLECGLFLEKMPGLDMISFGPTLKDIHSPSEKAHIPAVQSFWIYLGEILKRLAQ